MTNRSVKRKTYTVCLWIFRPKVRRASISRHIKRCISPRLTSQREADIMEMALTSAKSSWLDITNISWMRSALRAPSLHSWTIYTGYNITGHSILFLFSSIFLEIQITLFKVAMVIRQRSNSGVPLSSRWKMASTSSGNRVIRCIGNIRKLCMASDWHTGLDSSRRRTSTNCGLFSLRDWFE